MAPHNRVAPFGEIHAVPDRGLVMGNRGGCIDTPNKALKPHPWTSQRRIICVLDFKARKRPLIQPRLYTELFFLDATTALTGGQRPCYERRRPEALAFGAALDKSGCVSAKEPVSHVDARIAGEIQSVMKDRCARERQSPPPCPTRPSSRWAARRFSNGRTWPARGPSAAMASPRRYLPAPGASPSAPPALPLLAAIGPVLHPSAAP